MDKNPLLKYMMKEEVKDVLHTSAYARAQNSGAMGASSTQSFEERQKIEANRQAVRRYSDSNLMQQARISSPRASTYVKPADTPQNRPAPQRINPGITRK
ncbi:hypothetical protein IKT18_01735 [Candidatus Saccharibacteria bacterium]|nr:hypothetical protein [Candidatus Saccharibacteria bacterium]